MSRFRDVRIEGGQNQVGDHNHQRVEASMADDPKPTERERELGRDLAGEWWAGDVAVLLARYRQELRTSELSGLLDRIDASGWRVDGVRREGPHWHVWAMSTRGSSNNIAEVRHGYGASREDAARDLLASTEGGDRG